MASRKQAHTSGWRRPLAYLHIAVQTGMAITPFWAMTVQAAMPQPDDGEWQRTAGHLTTLAQVAQSRDINGFAAEQASGLATQQLQQWLQTFGTARVELGTDNHFKPHLGAVDVLLPLSKSEQHLFFTQNGLRNVDGQLTGNAGLGMRHFSGDWMLGYNAFYDQNFSRGHKRVGTGLEAWRDYLKLSGNGYYRLSGWRNAGDVEDYDARPANGYDLRAEAWLPAYPALGGRLMYEKYYGDEVALFSKDKRQKNPNAVTAGLSWTPVPLLSVSADHKKGGSQSEMLLGLQLNWHPGQSLASQLDPASVGLQRTLAGSGMDLVERNNAIVLEYRKQELITLTLPQTIAGTSGSTQAIRYQLAAKYGLSHIVWRDAAIIAAGGKIIDDGNGSYRLVMPKYVAGLPNSYVLSAVAHDTHNNTSKIATTTVSVARPAVSALRSSTVSALNTLPADGKSTTQITVTLVDEEGAPVTGLAAELAASVTEQSMPDSGSVTTAAVPQGVQPAQPARLSDITETGNGHYVMTLTTGNRPAVAVVTPTLGNLALPSVSISETSDTASAAVRDGDLTLITDSVIASGKDAARVRARVTDGSGNPVANMAVLFTLSGSARAAAGSSLTGVSDKNGYVTLLFTDTVAEKVTVTAATAAGSAQVQATFVADSQADAGKSALSVSAPAILADGSERAVVTLDLRDSYNNPITGQDVAFISSLQGSKLDTIRERGNGIYEASLSGTVPGTTTLSVTVAGNRLDVTTAQVVLKPAPVDLTVKVDSARKNIGERIQLTVNAVRKTTHQPAPQTKITLQVVETLNRQNQPASSGNLKLNGGEVTTYEGVTDASGNLVINITDPDGTGVKNTLELRAESGDTALQAVTFNVKTSPDVASATMWGNMTETVTVGGTTFHRPWLNSEKRGDGVQTYHNEDWGSYNFQTASKICTLPTKEELIKLYNAYPNNKLLDQLGWRTDNVYRTSSVQDKEHNYVYMDKGVVSFRKGGDGYHYDVICKQ